MIGVVIGQFSSLLEILNSKGRLKTEEIDILHSTMFNLRINENIQKKVTKYYEIITEPHLGFKKDAFKYLNHSLHEKIELYQIKGTVSDLSFIHQNNSELLKSLADNMSIEFFQAGDIVIKQHDIGRSFNFIMEGLAEVFLENEDYEFFNHH